MRIFSKDDYACVCVIKKETETPEFLKGSLPNLNVGSAIVNWCAVTGDSLLPHVLRNLGSMMVDLSASHYIKEDK